MEKAMLYIHGRGGNVSEAEQYRKVCDGFDIVGVDYNGYLPWSALEQIRAAYDETRKKYARISVLANSIGAYFAMHTLPCDGIEKALFISPVPDMERLILDMMDRAGVTEGELREKGEIQTDFGETLLWEYLSWARKNPTDWRVRTEILYASGDELISRETVDEFVKSHDAGLTVMENGEHRFHTGEQMDFLYWWIKKVM